MKKFTIIWYDMIEEIKREEIEVEDDEDERDAVKKAYEKYGGTKSAPAPCISVVGA